MTSYQVYFTKKDTSVVTTRQEDSIPALNSALMVKSGVVALLSGVGDPPRETIVCLINMVKPFGEAGSGSGLLPVDRCVREQRGGNARRLGGMIDEGCGPSMWCLQVAQLLFICSLVLQ